MAATKGTDLKFDTPKTYEGGMGTYTVIAKAGDSEAAINLSAVASYIGAKVGTNKVPTLGIAYRIRFYQRDGNKGNPFPGFKGASEYGQQDGAMTYRIKSYIPISHVAGGPKGLSDSWSKNDVTNEFVKQLKAAVKASKGVMVVSDTTLKALIEAPIEGIPAKVPVVFSGVNVHGVKSQPDVGNKLPAAAPPDSQYD